MKIKRDGEKTEVGREGEKHTNSTNHSECE